MIVQRPQRTVFLTPAFPGMCLGAEGKHVFPMSLKFHGFVISPTATDEELSTVNSFNYMKFEHLYN